MRFSMLYRLLLLTFLATSFFATANSQTPTPKPKPTVSDEDQVVKVNSRLIVIPVSVTDASGQAVPGLTVKDFRVAEENRPQTLDAVRTADEVPLEIALLFDVSASTDAMFKFEQQTAAKFLKDVMRANDRATIYTVGQTPTLVAGRDTADGAVNSVMKITPGKGATAFFDSVTAAATYLISNAPEGSRRVIVVISDGEDNFSEGVQRAGRLTEAKLTDGNGDPDYKKLGSVVAAAQQKAKTSERAKVAKALQDADTVFYSVNPAGSSYQLNQISVFGQENMQQFASQTGGSAFLPKFVPIDTKDALQNSANL